MKAENYPFYTIARVDTSLASALMVISRGLWKLIIVLPALLQTMPSRVSAMRWLTSALYLLLLHSSAQSGKTDISWHGNTPFSSRPPVSNRASKDRSAGYDTVSDAINAAGARFLSACLQYCRSAVNQSPSARPIVPQTNSHPHA